MRGGSVGRSTTTGGGLWATPNVEAAAKVMERAQGGRRVTSDFTVTYDSDAKGDSGDNWRFVPCFHVAQGASHLATVWAQMTSNARLDALHKLGMGRGSDDDAGLRDAFLRWTLKRLERELQDSDQATALINEKGATWKITSYDDEEIAAIVAEAGPKECDYQIRSRRDLFCSSPSAEDEAAVYLVDGRRVAATSRPTCAACNLPSTSWLCSHFLHPGVTGMGAMGGWYGRQITNAMCDLGHVDLINQEPSLCRTGGRDCWQRVVMNVQHEPRAALSPLSLPEALDFLDAVWRLAHRSEHLLGQVATSHAAGLALPAGNRDDFKSRVNDLTDTLDNLRVPAARSASGSSPPREATLGRLKAYLEGEFGADEAAIARVGQAIDTLRKINDVRNALQHSRAAPKLPLAFVALGLPYPPDWPAAWDGVRAIAVDALIALRDEVRRHWP